MSVTMALLCFGGTFNPIHHGHLICARAAAEIAHFNKIVLIPALIPPHKLNSAEIADPHHRLELCKKAVEADPLFEVSDIELLRDGPSYTFDTATELFRQGHQEISWLIGADMVASLPRWHRARELVELIDFVVMARPGWQMEWKTLPQEFRHLEHRVVATPLIAISATEVRERVRQGRSIDYLTPRPVVEYIQANRLYVAAEV
jgi:nicotinate-nucleotide adenylyltransferase